MGLCFDDGSETRVRITVLSLPLVSALLTSPVFILVLDGGKDQLASFISCVIIFFVVGVVGVVSGMAVPNTCHKTRTIFRLGRLSSVIEEDEEELSDGGSQRTSVFTLVRKGWSKTPDLEQIE